MTLARTHLALSPLLLAVAAPALAADVTVTLPAGDGFVVEDNTGAIERLRVDEATGNISRNGALFVHTTGTDNTFVGVGAGNTGTTGSGKNSAFGQDALASVITGVENSAFGYDALAANTTGIHNTAVGSHALNANMTGNFNSAFGTNALKVATGGYNSAFGSSALIRNTTGASNSAVGEGSLFYNTTGTSNVALGAAALSANTTGNRNVAIGRYAGLGQTTGNDNIYLANEGVAGENGQIKIGTEGTHSRAFVAGELALGDENAHRNLLTLRGPDDKDTGPIIFLFGDGADQVESGRIRFVEGTAGTNWRGAYIVYDGSGNALHIGTHSTNTDSTADDVNVLTIERASLHVGIQRSNPSFPLHVGTDGTNGNGAHVTTGGVWTNGSSRASKEAFERVDPEVVLAKVSALPIERWRYRGSDEGTHLGPMAEDFHAAFGLGASDAYIATVDADGVALAAIQGLQQRLEREHRNIEGQAAIIEEQQQVIAALSTRLEQVEQTLASAPMGADR